MPPVWKKLLFLLLLAALSAQGCSGTPELVSEASVEDKISRLKIGRSDKVEIESIFGTQRRSDGNRWSYEFADTQFEISERRQGPGVGILPMAAGTVATNTRAVVTMSFNEAGIAKTIEVARYFEAPFTNEYWYLLKDTAKNPLASVAALAEGRGFRVVGMDTERSSFDLEAPAGKARMSVKIEGRTLRITSRNPYHRLSNEYRSYTKRESALTSAIRASEIVE